MDSQRITVSAKIGADVFRRFAIFDTLRLKKRWRSPLLFALILSACACVCFFMRARREGALLLGFVLLGVGLGLPATYFLNFYLSLQAQCKKMRLDQPRLAYTLTFTPVGVHASTEREQADYAWEQLYRAYRVEGCTYLYPIPARVFLLPEGQADAPDDALWVMLQERLPAGCAVDCRK
ncbi:MAG: YcxB family protein [Clostridia bacterium]|nr:YcxB family protein [Clostridia bacterium]